MTVDEHFYSFGKQFGRAAALILAGAGGAAKMRSLVEEFAAFLPTFAGRCTDVPLLIDDDARTLRPTGLELVPLHLVDCGNFLSLYGIRFTNKFILVLDRNLRITLRTLPFDTTSPTQPPSGGADIALI